MTSVRASPAGTPYPNQSQSPDWSAHHPAPRVSSLAGEDRRNQASNKYAEARSAAGRVNASAASATSTPVAARSRTSSVDSLITATSTEELHDSGESVVTTRLQIPVNKVADTIQRYQAHTQAHSQGQDPAERSERSPSVSPNPGNVLRKSESWHQLAAQQQGLSGAGSGAGLGGRTGRPQSMHGGQDLPPAAPARSPALPKAKSSHNLAFPKQFEAAIKPDALQVKQKTVEQYFRKTDGGSGGDARTSVKHQHQHQQQQYSKKSVQSALTVNTKRHSQTSSSHEPLTPMEVLLVDDNLDNVDEAFESLFAASVGSDGRTLTRQTSAEGKANYKQRRMSHTKSKLGGYSASVSRTSGAQGGGAVKSSK
ncbi:hypothetical protein ONE63_002708 [Megalurothrips usitatus]|uniref:Uncharacterized protein n=1 Tax=Megalurothrips usitatus TaxID=439358 RepID=A0AAV7XCK6_9NEOP|nr:hypothetical protein ONE63_002708 [Megalurothrips usitatus]